MLFTKNSIGGFALLLDWRINADRFVKLGISHHNERIIIIIIIFFINLFQYLNLESVETKK